MSAPALPPKLREQPDLFDNPRTHLSDEAIAIAFEHSRWAKSAGLTPAAVFESLGISAASKDIGGKAIFLYPTWDDAVWLLASVCPPAPAEMVGVPDDVQSTDDDDEGDDMRMRTIAPEQWTDEDFVACSPLARLLLLGLRSDADDHGVFEWRPASLKMRVLAADQVDVNELLAELVGHRQVARFEANGTTYGVCLKWGQKQRRPHYRYPVPPAAIVQSDVVGSEYDNVRHEPDNVGSEHDNVRPNPNPNPNPEREGGNPPNPPLRRQATPLSQDFEFPPDWFSEAADALARSLKPAINLAAEAETFRRHFAGRRKADWRGEFVKWCVNSRAAADTEAAAAAPIDEVQGIAVPHALGDAGDRLLATIGATAFRQWFAEVRAGGIVGGNLTLFVATSFRKNWLRSHYEPQILAAWRPDGVDRIDIKVAKAPTAQPAMLLPIDGSGTDEIGNVKPAPPEAKEAAA
jgi:hypothetical protein